MNGLEKAHDQVMMSCLTVMTSCCLMMTSHHLKMMLFFPMQCPAEWPPSCNKMQHKLEAVWVTAAACNTTQENAMTWTNMTTIPPPKKKRHTCLTNQSTVDLHSCIRARKSHCSAQHQSSTQLGSRSILVLLCKWWCSIFQMLPPPSPPTNGSQGCLKQSETAGWERRRGRVINTNHHCGVFPKQRSNRDPLSHLFLRWHCRVSHQRFRWQGGVYFLSPPFTEPQGVFNCTGGGVFQWCIHCFWEG